MATSEDGTPLQGSGREKQVRRIFSEIAPRYDLLNHLLSLNVDRRWRRRAVDLLGWEAQPDGHFLDACAGTLDLSLELASRRGFQGRVVAADFAWPMLVEGKGKIGSRRVLPVCGDVQRMPFPDQAFRGAMVAFGVRNLSDLRRGLEEFARVLAPGGHLVILEFTDPPNALLRTVYHTYFRRVLPLIGKWVSGHPWAYSYLPRSVAAFPDPTGLAAQIRRAGFREVEWELLTGGIAALHVATR